MKVLHVLYSGLGGHSNVFFSMVTADQQKEFEFEAIFNGIENVREDYIEACTENNIPWQFVKKKPGEHLGFFFRLANAIRKSQPDIIFVHGSINVTVARFASLLTAKKQKIIVRETQANHLKTKREWTGLKLAMRLADKIVFLSNEYNDEIRQKLPGNYNPSKTSVIPNGLDLELYKPSLNKITGPVVIGMQSRLVPIKDHETMLRAVSKIISQNAGINLQLRIAGDGSHRPFLEQLTRELNLQDSVTFTGMLNEKDLVNFLQSLNIYIHASLGETMSTAIMQAMACRLPIIASDVAGINNMIKNSETGILVPPKDQQAMADAIEFFIKNPLETDKFAANAYGYAVANFSNKVMFEKYKAIFLSN